MDAAFGDASVTGWEALEHVTWVAQGDLLGTTDTFATLIGKGLYFEVRHGSVAEDPTTWLKPGALSRAPKKTVLPPAGAGPEKPADAPPAPSPDETPLVPIPNQNDNQEAPSVPPDKHASLDRKSVV